MPPPPPPVRKRRAPSDIRGADAAAPSQRRRTQGAATQPARRRTNGGSSTQAARRGTNRRAREEEEEEEEEEEAEAEVDDDDDDEENHGEMHKNRLAKNVVRLALAQEFTRAPIKRQNISSKALGSANSRQFKEIFSMAQNDLRHIFGMEMVELPVREKTKLAARRNAQNADKAPNSSNSYILTSVLPPQFMVPEIVQLRGEGEKSYTGLVTFITALIYLNGRALPAVKLDRYMRTLNANEYTPCGALDTVLQRMQKHGYIIRIKDNTGEETQYEYHLGPRAKVEIGEDGIKSLIKTVYGDEEVEDLDVKFKRNIGLELKNNFDEEDDDDAEVPAAGDRRKKKAAPKRGRRRNEDEDDE